MNENNISKSVFRWILFSILLIFLIFFGVRKLGMEITQEDKQTSESTLETEVIPPETGELKELVEKIPARQIEDELKIEEKEPLKSQEKPVVDLESKLLSRFTIQVASFQDKAKAEKIIEELKNKGYAPTISAKGLGEKGIWHRVFVGDFETEDEAGEALKMLKENYKDSFIKLR